MVIDKLIAVVRSIASERPDTTYGSVPGQGCYYDKGECSDGSTGCIFGQALTRMGYKVYGLDGNLSIDGLLEDMGVACEEDQEDWCRKVQDGQDSGKSWEDAVACADETLQERYKIRELT